MAELRAFVAGCEGGREWKGMDAGGGPRSSATLFFEGMEGKEGEEEERVDEGGRNGEEEERADERMGKEKEEQRGDERGRKGKKLRAKKRGKKRRDGDGEDVD